MNFFPTCRHLAAALCLFTASSCATIIDGTTQAITIDSNVEGASVAVNGSSVGVTPWTGQIKRMRSGTALVSMEGYSAETLSLTTSYNTTALLSIFWDYSTTDFLTGAVWEYAPSSYYANLKSTSSSDADFRRESSLKALAMTYFGDLQTELAAGNGPKLRAMHDQYFSDRPIKEFIESVQAAPNTDNVSFGESVAGLLNS